MFFPLFCAFIILAWSLGLIGRKKWKLNWAPGPWHIPIVGSSLIFAYNYFFCKPNYQIMGEYSEKYGKICGFFVGIHYTMLIDDYEIAKEVMASPDLLARYPPTSASFHYYFKKNLGLLYSHGQFWKEIRSFTVRNLRNYGFGRTMSMEESLNTELAEFLSLIEAKNYELDVNGLTFNLSVMNVLWSYMIGKRFALDDKRGQDLVRLVEEMAKAESPGTSPLFAFPILRLIPWLTEFQEVAKLYGQAVDFFREIIEEKRSIGTYAIEPCDFIDAFLIEIDKGISPFYTDEALIMTAVDLFLGGSDTTAVSLEWALYYMLNNPSALSDVQEEIDRVVGNKTITLGDKQSLPLVEATILEIFRMGNVLPLTARATVRPYKLNAYDVPSNSYLIFNLKRFNLSEKLWENPNEFYPKRFLSKDRKIVNGDKILSFGYGKRVCLGESLARSGLFVFFANLVQKFNFKGTITSHQPINGFTVSPPHFKLKLVPRIF